MNRKKNIKKINKTNKAGISHEKFLKPFRPLLKNHPYHFFLEHYLYSTFKVLESNLDLLDVKIINSTIRELRYAFEVFKPYRHVRKASVFGSARTKASDPYYKSAVKFGKLLVKNNWMVITGAASGIMHAGNVGAGKKNSFGVNIRLPFEQDANEILRNDPKLVNFKYFFTRKLIFMKEADAIVLFPGGFGTFDEGYETLTLVQTGKTTPRPVIMIDTPRGTYWRDFNNFITKQLLPRKLISPEDLSLYKIVRSPEAAILELKKFYKNFHSVRYFPKRTVIRVKKKPTATLLRNINKKFDSLLKSGTFHLSPASSDEDKGEPEIKHYYRIAFNFNRRNFGLLNLLIEYLNDKG